jgi:F0F1-type ATP synthase membrane subunit b/b'
MAEFDKKIARLEEEIEGYNADYKIALTEDKRLLLQTINSARETLNRLLDEKQALSRGR